MHRDEPGGGPGRGKASARTGDTPIVRDLNAPTDAELVEPHEVERLCAEGVALVDLREPAAFEAAHLPGAVNIPAQALIERPAQALGAVILYDDDGGLAARLCCGLRQAVGELEFFVLKGGLNAWRDAGLPLEER